MGYLRMRFIRTHAERMDELNRQPSKSAEKKPQRLSQTFAEN